MPAHPEPAAPHVPDAHEAPDASDAHDLPDAHDAPGDTAFAPRLEALERMVVRQQESLDQHARLIHRLRMELLAQRRWDRDQRQDQNQRSAGKD
ncbi:hypothetical protein [Desulfocurvibacter africanus]|uniref:hypothetical protein n=1 Tax=Desulfocurvibacter africanus TaxID=873 RepID=UPI0003F971F4|nr:hypothetical protein [Desulfocurvibacter africanus]